MVHTRSKKNAANSNGTLKENEAAENDILESPDPTRMTMDQFNAGVPREDNIEKSLDWESNEKEKETCSGEEKITIKADSSDKIIETSHENLVDENQNVSKDNGVDYQKDEICESHEEKSEGHGEECAVGMNEVDVELESEEDEEAEEGDEGSEEGDEESEEDAYESEDGDEELADGSQESDKEMKGKEEVAGEAIVSVGGGKPEELNKEKVESDLKEVVDKSPRRTRKKLKVESTKEDMPKISRIKKSGKRVKSMGMIFMCNSRTKSDCYRYRVFGLPASKKDVVEKIYKGMRLFLYDVDLKLLNGIYKAAGPGGYNIEPKAFNSQFPSQVRFTILDDCLPVAEERFRKVIKDNYYTNTKFDCLLTSEQVKKLCNLFMDSSRRQRHSHLVRNIKAENSKVVLRDGNRHREKRSVGASHHAAREELGLRERPHKRPRKTISSTAPVPSSVPSYAYRRTLEMDVYPRNPRSKNHDPRHDVRDPLVSGGDSYRERRVPPSERFDSYREGHEGRNYYRGDQTTGREDPYRDVCGSYRKSLSPCRDGHEGRNYYRGDQTTGREVPYRDMRRSYRKSRSPYRDGGDSYVQHQSPYMDARDSYLQRQSPYMDGRDSYLQRRSPYRDVQDSYLRHRSPYRDVRDQHVELRDPYRSGRDLFHEHQSPYRDGRETYQNDMRDSYLQRPYEVTPLTEPHDTLNRGPISDRDGFYREERAAVIRDSYDRLHDLPPAHPEKRQIPETNQDSYISYRLPVTKPTHPAEYPSGAVLERDYHPVGPVTDLYSTRGRLSEYSSR